MKQLTCIPSIFFYVTFSSNKDVPGVTRKILSVFWLNTFTVSVFILDSKLPIWLSILRLGPWIWTEGGILGSVSVHQFHASEGTLFATFIAMWMQIVDVPPIACDGRRCRWRALLCDPQTRKQLITAVSPSLHPWTSRWATGQCSWPLRASHHVTCLRLPQWWLFWNEVILHFPFT